MLREIKAEFSEKEMEMIKFLSPHWYKIINENGDGINEISVLEIIGRHCFIENRKGPVVDSLRRCLKAISECNPYRFTKEYDNLIQLK